MTFEDDRMLVGDARRSVRALSQLLIDDLRKVTDEIGRYGALAQMTDLPALTVEGERLTVWRGLLEELLERFTADLAAAARHGDAP